MSKEVRDKVGISSGFSRRNFLKTAAAAAGLSLLAGCGGGGGQAPKADEKKDPKPAAPAKEALKIGVLLPFSKVYAVLGESITQGMELYFEQVKNEAGGRKIELIKEDEENDAQASLRKTRKFIESDKVDLMTGVVNSGVALALRDVIHGAKLPFIISNAGANDLTRAKKSPYIFRSSFSNWQPNWAAGEYVYKNVAKKVYLTAPDYAAGKEQMAAFKESFTKAGGTVLGEVYPPLGNNDYAPFLAKIKEAKPEAVYCFYSGSDAVKFVKQFDEYGLRKTMKLCGAGFSFEEDVLPAQGKSALGAISGMHWAFGLDTPLNKKFLDDYKKKFNKGANVFSLQGYDTARVIVEAVNAVKGDTADKDKLVKAISAVKFDSPRGPFAFDPDTNNVVQDIYIREVKDVSGHLHNVVIATVKNVKDPGK